MFPRAFSTPGASERRRIAGAGAEESGSGLWPTGELMLPLHYTVDVKADLLLTISTTVTSIVHVPEIAAMSLPSDHLNKEEDLLAENVMERQERWCA
jgi:hypothetical protein